MRLSRNNAGELVLADGIKARQLVEEFGSPLYVYDAAVLRQRCQEMLQLAVDPNFVVAYSVKANSNPHLLRIIHQEGIHCDAISPGEIAMIEHSGVPRTHIRYVSNNATAQQMQSVVERGVECVVDSVCQLRLFGAINPGGAVTVRLNPTAGAGHHEKVVTAGAVKFGIDWPLIDTLFSEAQAAGCTIKGIMVHIGSLFLDYAQFHETVQLLLDVASTYPQIELIDFGGGFGIPYRRDTEQPFPITAYADLLRSTIADWRGQHPARTMTFAIEPGRYLVGECGVCLGQVLSEKINQGVRFLGTDIGFNVLARPVLYDSYHEIMNADRNSANKASYTITGNICESGDILGRERSLPADTALYDTLLIRDTGAYGYTMSSNYNSFLKPAEVLLDTNEPPRLIRKRQSEDQLFANLTPLL